MRRARSRPLTAPRRSCRCDRACRSERRMTTSATARRPCSPRWRSRPARSDACYDRHGKAEFLDFMKKVARAYPRRELHVVCDNYHTHKHDEINGWLTRHPRITLHFTPTSGSWLNMVEVFFSIITRQAIRRGTFRSVRELTEAIRGFIDGWNDRRHPFTWTKTADEILPHARRQRTSDAGH